ncbi:Zinc ion binding [Mactra antiquata]
MNSSQIQRQVECPVCFEQFTTPKVLPCQHTFCLRCLETNHNTNGGGNRVSCPECRAQHQIPSNGISGFPTSVTVQRLIEALSAPNVPQQRPSAQPLPPTRNQDNNYPHGSNNDRLDLGRVILFVDQQRVLERNAGRNQPQGRTVGTPGRNEGHTNNINIIPDASSNRCTFTSVRRIYRRYLGRLFQDKEIISLCLLCHLTFMTFSRFIAGAVKLSSDCEDESNAAVYLFVKSWFEFFLHVAILLFLYKDKIEKALDNLFVQVWLIIQTTFSIIWLIVGEWTQLAFLLSMD